MIGPRGGGRGAETLSVNPPRGGGRGAETLSVNPAFSSTPPDMADNWSSSRVAASPPYFTALINVDLWVIVPVLTFRRPSPFFRNLRKCHMVEEN